jgi:hypothetical protein
MKNTILVLGILLSMLGCNKEEEIIPLDTTNIIGTWQLIARFDGGSPVPLREVDNGFLYEFKSDSTFSSSNTVGCRYNGVIGGLFSLSAFQSYSIITLKFLCDIDYIVEVEKKSSFEDNMLILRPNNPSCDEGCYDKFKKIAEEKKEVSAG